MNKQVAVILGLLLAMCLLLGMMVNVIDIDSAQYASMSTEMLRNKSYLQLYDIGFDYLDKPPLIFWLSSLSISVFGISNFAFKLPSVLIALLGVYSVYRFTKLFYDNKTAITAAVMYSSCVAFILMNNDVRTDTMLTGSTMFAVWQLAAFTQFKKWSNLILAAVGLALGMLAKGPLALMLPVFAFGAHWVLKREWKNIFNPKWIVVIGVIGVMLIPMCIGLYQQFDLHPEKVLYGKQGTSGLRFFFWTQSFGRVTGESTWNNHPDTFFLLHTTAWAFLPWTIFLFSGVILAVKKLVLYVRGKVEGPNTEFISIAGFAVTMLALMSSKYQLSHYPYITYPLASVLSAVAFQQWYSNSSNLLAKATTVLQWITVIAIWVACIILVTYCFPANTTLAVLLIIALIAGSTYAYFKEEAKQKLLVLSAASMLSAGVLLNAFVFPQILKCQADSEVAIAANQLKVGKGKLISYGIYTLRSTSFYRDEFVKAYYSTNNIKSMGEIYVYTTPYNLQELRNVDAGLTIEREFDNFQVSRLSVAFINPATRNSVIEKRLLVKMRT